MYSYCKNCKRVDVAVFGGTEVEEVCPNGYDVGAPKVEGTCVMFVPTAGYLYHIDHLANKANWTELNEREQKMLDEFEQRTFFFSELDIDTDDDLDDFDVNDALAELDLIE